MASRRGPVHEGRRIRSPAVIASVPLVTNDGVTLEAEVSDAEDERARIVLCHPHPLHGGTMRSLVISELFRVLPLAGITCLRFNFRGVEGSEGSYDGGDAERRDVRAALGYVAAVASAPCFVVGWSFGADVALSAREPEVAGWIGIAAPLRYTHDLDALARDPRPKLLVLAENDEVRSPSEIVAQTDAWVGTRCEIVAGASHFFVGRTDQLCDRAEAWITEQLRYQRQA